MSQDGTSGIPEISPTALRERMEGADPPVLLDVREEVELGIVQLPAEYGVRWIPMREVEGRAEELERERDLVVFCRSGQRSGLVVQLLRDLGFERAVNLQGGLLGWRDEVDPSLPVY